tara:strand:- start:600 stop:1427 length:828 start_codon:yes stop_codon:yes gene_type:complete
MKKVFLFVFLLMISLNLVSAVSYECNSGFEENSKEINLGDDKSISGLRIGVAYSAEIVVLNKITAEILIDTEKITLTNDTSLQEIELKTGSYDIELKNHTSSETGIEVENDDETLEEGDITNVDDIFVFFFKGEGENLEEANIELVLGSKRVSLSNTENPEELVTINDEEYVVELKSASSNSAIIKVKTCTESITEKVEETTTNTTASNVTIGNDSLGERDEDVIKINETVKNTTSDNLNNGESRNMLPYYGIGIVIVVLIFFGIGFKRRSEKYK